MGTKLTPAFRCASARPRWRFILCEARFIRTRGQPHLAHLPVQGDGGDPQVPEQQRHPLGVVARAAEDHEGVAGQLVQNGHQIAVLQENRGFNEQDLKLIHRVEPHLCPEINLDSLN